MRFLSFKNILIFIIFFTFSKHILSAPSSNTLSNIEIESTEEIIKVILTIDSKKTFDYTVERFPSPNRITIEFNDTNLGNLEKISKINYDYIKEIVLKEFREETLIISQININVSEFTPYIISQENNKIFLSIENSSKAINPKINLLINDAVKPAENTSKKKPAEKLSEKVPAKPVEVKSDKSKQNEVQMNSDKASEIQPEQTKTQEDTQPTITLDLSDAEIKTAFLMISFSINKQIVVDDEIQGKISVSFDNVPWLEAINKIVSDKELKYSIEGNIIYVNQKDSAE